MAEYRATLSQSQQREGWSVIFRHPVRIDPATGKVGRRVRRGLGTPDKAEAERLVGQVNEILADRTMWEVSARPLAENRFEKIVVDIFYHDILPQPVDPFAVRDSLIPLPSSENSHYRRVQLLGTTGGGKTTMVRQFVGTDPRSERFPSTSTAKTTVADSEIVLDDGPFRAVVTFLPRDLVRDHVEECILAAALATYKGEPPREILRKLLNHVDQRFRLNYILGNGGQAIPADDDDEGESLFDDDPTDNVPAIDLEDTNALLQGAIGRLRAVTEAHAARLRAELDAAKEDERVIEEIFEENLDHILREDEDIQTLADDIMDEIGKRFDAIPHGDVQKSKQGWPTVWHWETDDRRAFVTAVSRFSSNYAPYFGTLLTPLVNGIRVAGPFRPRWSQRQPALVIFDGEGLGHTPESSASIPTSVSQRFDEVDAVLLVDSAKQPMQAAPVAVMRNLASSGKTRKLLICLTHFDMVSGDNLRGFQAKEQHVLASAENALTAIGNELGPFAERALRKRLSTGCFFVGGIDQPLDEESKRGKRTVDQLTCLLDAIDRIVDKPSPVTARPTYDRMNLVLAVKNAAEHFHDAWEARLGRASRSGISKEHWTRVKALSRRFAEQWADQYDTLMPVADLHRELKESIYVFIQNPVDWQGASPTDDDKQQIFDGFADAISSLILNISKRRLGQDRVQTWQKAFNESGRGSTFVRATIIADGVYGQAAPVPTVAPTPDRNRFLHEIIEAVDTAAKTCDVTLR